MTNVEIRKEDDGMMRVEGSLLCKKGGLSIKATNMIYEALTKIPSNKGVLQSQGIEWRNCK